MKPERFIDDRGLIPALVADGRPLLTLTALGLIASGLFAFFLAATRHFLPHDVAYLGMTAEQLCAAQQCRIVHFMMHDRVSFGGALVGIGVLYLWLIEFPLRAREGWAWWTLAVSGSIGFGSFLVYLGYGYLDTWHGAATLLLLPVFVAGMAKSVAALAPLPSIRVLFQAGTPIVWSSASGVGQALLLVTSACLVLGGLIICVVGTTDVFVPQDLEYLALTREDLNAISPRLIPLIAHDRAGFGGGVCCCGVTMFCCVKCGTPARSLWQAVLITGLIGFGTAVGVHFPIGYMNLIHLAPAILGTAMFVSGMALTYRRMVRARSKPTSPQRAAVES